VQLRSRSLYTGDIQVPGNDSNKLRTRQWKVKNCCTGSCFQNLLSVTSGLISWQSELRYCDRQANRTQQLSHKIMNLHTCVYIYRLHPHENQTKYFKMNSHKEKHKRRNHKNENA